MPSLSASHAPSAAAAAAAIVIEDHGHVRVRYHATEAAALEGYRWLPLRFASAVFGREGDKWVARKTYGTPNAVGLIEVVAALPKACGAVAVAECWDAPASAVHTHAGARGEILATGGDETPMAMRMAIRRALGSAPSPEASGAPPGTELCFVSCPVGVRPGETVAFVTPTRTFAKVVVPATIPPGLRFVVTLRPDEGTILL